MPVGMEKRLAYLEQRVNELLTTARNPCSGCAALSRRVAELERRLDDPGELEDTPGDPTGAAAGPGWANGEPNIVDVLLLQAAGEPTAAEIVDAFLRETAEESDTVNALQETAGGTDPMDTGDVLLQRAAAETDPMDVLLWEATD